MLTAYSIRLTAIFLLGLFLGSFASVLIARTRTGEKGRLMGRSKCPKCHHILGALDLVPVLSYLFSGGKCRYCHKKISPFYPLLELGMGLLFALTFWLAGPAVGSWILATYLGMTFAFVLISVYDGLYQEVPDVFSLPTALFCLIAFPVLGLYDPWEGLMGLIVPTLFFGTLFLGSKGRWLGEGDLRIGWIMGAVLGHPLVILGLFLGYLFGALFSVIGLLAKKLTRKSTLAFGPFLLAGTYVALFFGERIWQWYFSFI